MNIPAEIRRWVALGVLIVVLLFAGAVLTMCNARKEAAVARSEAKVDTAQANAGSAAVRATEGRYERDAATDAQTKSNADFIEDAENARESAGQAGLRGRVAYCRRMRNDDPICTGL